MKKFICVLAVVVLVICLLSGGCSETVEKPTVKTWRDLLNPIPGQPVTNQSAEIKPEESRDGVEQPAADMVEVVLYFYDQNQKTLVAEPTKIIKTEGIARRTMEKLLAGPANSGYTAIAPAGTKLLDINIKKEERLCIVDLSSEAKQVADHQQAQNLLDAVTKTLCQFPTVNEVRILINGQMVDEISAFKTVLPQLQPNKAL